MKTHNTFSTQMLNYSFNQLLVDFLNLDNLLLIFVLL